MPVCGQLVAPAEFERIVESQGVVEHQPQPDERDRADRRQQQSQTRRRSRHAWATGTSRMTAPNNNDGRAPTANPYATLAAASHRHLRSGSCNAHQIAPSASIVSIYPQLIGTS